MSNLSARPRLVFARPSESSLQGRENDISSYSNQHFSSPPKDTSIYFPYPFLTATSQSSKKRTLSVPVTQPPNQTLTVPLFPPHPRAQNHKSISLSKPRKRSNWHKRSMGSWNLSQNYRNYQGTDCEGVWKEVVKEALVRGWDADSADGIKWRI